MKRKWVFLIIIALILIIQFIRIDKNAPEIKIENDFLSLNKPPAEIEKLIKNSCYDCHSNQVNYPWYSNIAPVSWYIKHHINEGREIVNFSEWNSYSKSKSKRILEECAETVELETMPLSTYAFMHKEANMSKEQLKSLGSWFAQKAGE